MNHGYQGRAVALIPGRLRGYRQWMLVDLTGNGDLVLQSLTARTRWPWTPQVTARCHKDSMAGYRTAQTHSDDEVPKRDCTCGIYAKHRPEQLDRSSPVDGVIEAWGPHTEIGEYGFRARHARLVALWLRPLMDSRQRERFEATHANIIRHAGRLSPGWHSVVPESEQQRGLFVPEPDPTQAIAARLQEIYRVKVYHDRDEMIWDYPPVDIEALFPEPEPEHRPGIDPPYGTAYMGTTQNGGKLYRIPPTV